MWPYRQPPNAADRFLRVPTRKPIAPSPDSATRQIRSPVPTCSLMNRRPSADALDGWISSSPRSRWYARSATQSAATLPTSSALAALTWTSPDLGVRPRGPPAPGGVSLPLEDRLPLLKERAEAFLRVRHREQAVLQLPLEGEALLDRHLHPLDDGALDQAHRAARMVRIREPLRVRHRLVHEGVRVPHAVHEAPLERLVRCEGAAGRHEIDRPRLPDEPREPLRAARPWKDAEGDLGEPDLVLPLRVRTPRHEAQVAREGDLEPASNAVPVQRGDEELRGLLELVERLLAVQAEHRLVVRRGAREDIDVGARGPHPVELAREHGDDNAVVEAHVLDDGVEVPHQVEVVRVRLRLVQPRDRDAVLLLELDVLQLHGLSPGLRERSRSAALRLRPRALIRGASRVR